jgi:hypothetical protein
VLEWDVKLVGNDVVRLGVEGEVVLKNFLYRPCLGICVSGYVGIYIIGGWSGRNESLANFYSNL